MSLNFLRNERFFKGLFVQSLNHQKRGVFSPEAKTQTSSKKAQHATHTVGEASGSLEVNRFFLFTKEIVAGSAFFAKMGGQARFKITKFVVQ